MIETEILFIDDANESLGTPERMLWGKFAFDPAEIVACCEYIDKGELIPGASQIAIRFVGFYTIKMPYEKILKLWMEAKKKKSICLN